MRQQEEISLRKVNTISDIRIYLSTELKFSYRAQIRPRSALPGQGSCLVHYARLIEWKDWK